MRAVWKEKSLSPARKTFSSFESDSAKSGVAAGPLPGDEEPSVMRRQFVAQAARHANFPVRALLLYLTDLANQHIELLLLAHDDLVKLIHHVFGEAGLDLQISQALFDVVRVFHPPIGHEFRVL